MSTIRTRNPIPACRVFAGLAGTLGLPTSTLKPIAWESWEWCRMRMNADDCSTIWLHESSQSRRSWPVQDLSPKPAWILPLSAALCCWLPKHSTQERKKLEFPLMQAYSKLKQHEAAMATQKLAFPCTHPVTSSLIFARRDVTLARTGIKNTKREAATQCQTLAAA